MVDHAIRCIVSVTSLAKLYELEDRKWDFFIVLCASIDVDAMSDSPSFLFSASVKQNPGNARFSPDL